nr:PREDICTED: uncharacterized protein LOC109031067 isoform X1 [Bemisia tabaci]
MRTYTLLALLVVLGAAVIAHPANDNAGKESTKPAEPNDDTGKDTTKPRKSDDDTGKETTKPRKSDDDTGKETTKPANSNDDTGKNTVFPATWNPKKTDDGSGKDVTKPAKPDNDNGKDKNTENNSKVKAKDVTEANPDKTTIKPESGENNRNDTIAISRTLLSNLVNSIAEISSGVFAAIG